MVWIKTRRRTKIDPITPTIEFWVLSVKRIYLDTDFDSREQKEKTKKVHGSKTDWRGKRKI